MASRRWLSLLVALTGLLACDSDSSQGNRAGASRATLASDRGSASKAPPWSAAKPPDSGIRHSFELANAKASPADRERAADIVRRRLRAVKLGSFAVRVEGEFVVVDLPTATTPSTEELLDIIRRQGRLEFKLIDDDTDWLSPAADDDDIPLLTIEEESAPVGRDRYELRNFATLRTGVGGDHREGLRWLRKWAKTRTVDDDHEVGFEALYDDSAAGQPQVGWRSYYLWRNVEIDGRSIAKVEAKADDRGGMGNWSVLIDFDRNGTARLAELTRRNIRRRMAIVSDGIVVSAPVILDTISGGAVRVTMGGGSLAQQRKEARALAILLQVEALPHALSPAKQEPFGR